MINVEFNIKNYNQLIISVDSDGVETLITQLGYLIDKSDHFHLYSPAWSSLGGAELSERMLSGKEFHWCHELSVGTISNYPNNPIHVFVDASMSDREYTALQISLLRDQPELKELLELLQELKHNNNDFSISLKSLYEIKKTFHLKRQHYNKLELTFRHLNP